MELMNCILQEAVGIRYPFVLTQMFHPRFHEECFQEPRFLGGVLKNAPRVGAVTAALL
jgi:hypothetical protein